MAEKEHGKEIGKLDEKLNPENENNEQFDEDEDDSMIELTDDNGETVLYEQLGSFDFEGNTYLALSEPAENDQEAENEDVEVFLLRYDHDENGTEVFTTPDDEEADRAFEYFCSLVDDQEEEE